MGFKMDQRWPKIFPREPKRLLSTKVLLTEALCKQKFCLQSPSVNKMLVNRRPGEPKLGPAGAKRGPENYKLVIRWSMSAPGWPKDGPGEL